ncbi:unnamed protein product [Adineta ricciae]|uniref:Sulfotransferase domain-containing protein n=1 Tax=Adineta ricciae TaxID=249248 RepID=A0A815RYJ8_ADIRI|nr:unnamed protein product [Adineta ricciae]CAF1515267.1 unnamed protein product [Adineta ricciae]
MHSINDQDINSSNDEISKYSDKYLYHIYNGLCLPPYITPERLEFCQNITPRPNDICFISYPKSGSTWLAYILSCLVCKGMKPSEEFLKKHIIWPEATDCTVAELDQLPDTRIFKSHMPYDQHVIGCQSMPIELSPMKYIYIARNPKDVAVSYYKFEYDKSWSNYHGTWEQWFERFINGHVQRGSWFDHILSWYDHRHSPNLLIIWYEDLFLQFHSTVRQISKFLNRADITDEIIEKIYNDTRFDTMKHDEAFITMNMRDKWEHKNHIGLFFRSGKIGNWKKHFTTEQNNQFDKVFLEKIGGTGLSSITFEVEE